jgi:hypothetical protein
LSASLALFDGDGDFAACCSGHLPHLVSSP